MINMFVVRKFAALVIGPILAVILFYIGVVFYGLMIGIGFLVIGLLLAIILGVLFLRNPFTEMLEGKGILALNLDSTGVITPFIVSVQSPFIKGKVNGKPVKDTFNRSIVHNLAVPKMAGKGTPQSDGGLDLKITNEEFNKNRFALFHYPLLFYNQQTGSFISKDFLGEQEKSAFAEHGVLYLNRIMEDLTSNIRDFGRYIVETLKPKGSIFSGKVGIIIIIIAVILLIVLFGPSIINAISGTAGTATAAVSTAAGATGSIMPV